MVTIFALTAALLYGSADFLGGVATRRARVIAILPLSAASGAAIVLVAALLAGQSASAAGLGWGAAGGAVGGVGLMVFYAGLAEGPMSVVAPVSALMSTVLPIGFALAEGERLTGIEYAGVAVCLIAIVLVSSAAPADSRPARRAGLRGWLGRSGFHGRAVGYGLIAGTTFGLFFIFLRNAGREGELWPVTAARLAGLAVILLAALVTRTRPVLAGSSRRLLLATVGSGALDATANVFYVYATRAGLFGLAVVLISLYPGITVVLARFALGERMRPTQQAGLLLAAAGVVLVTI
jgi:drug/metabolite transporter (DMT)-like permease